MAVVMTGTAFAAAVWYFGSTRAAVAYFRGSTLFVEVVYQKVSPVEAGEVGSASFRIQNLRSKPVTVFGVQTSCSCTSADSLPLIIPPGQDRTMWFRVATYEDQAHKNLTETAVLLYDPSGPAVNLRIEVPVLPRQPLANR